MIRIFLIRYWKYFAVVGVLTVLGWWHVHETAKAYRQGATDRERSALQEAAVKVEADTAATRKELADRQLELDQQLARMQGERSAIQSARAGIKDALSASLNQIAVQGVDIRNEVQSVPDDAVNARFRVALERAKQAERDRARNPVDASALGLLPGGKLPGEPAGADEIQ